MAVLLVFSNLVPIGFAQEVNYVLELTSMNVQGGSALVANPVMNAPFKAYWVQLGANDEIDSLMFEIHHPNNPNLSYDPPSGTMLQGLVDTQGTWNNGLIIKVYENGAQVDTLVLYVSSQVEPQNPPAAMPAEETESPAPITLNAAVQVNYIDSNDKLIAQDSQTLTEAGQHTIYANPSLLPADYELAGDHAVTVELHNDNTLSLDSVHFLVRQKVQALSATLYVNYMSSDGNSLAYDEVVIDEVGTKTIHADSSKVPEAYTLQSAPSVEVTLESNGNLSPSTIEFVYSPPAQTEPEETEEPKMEPVTVALRYVDENDTDIQNPSQIVFDSYGEKAVAEYKIQIEGYEFVSGPESLWIFDNGAAEPAELKFVYKKLGGENTSTETSNPESGTKTIPVKYQSTSGTELAPSHEASLQIGENEVHAQVTEIQGYTLNGSSSQTVTLYDDGSVSQREIVFEFTANDADAEEKEPTGEKTGLGKAVVSSSNDVNIRKKPAGSIITRLKPGTEVTVLEIVENKGKEWAKIEYGNKKVAYILTEYLEMQNAQATAEPSIEPIVTPEPVQSTAPVGGENTSVSAELRVELLEGVNILASYTETLKGVGEHTVIPRQVPEVANYNLQGVASQVVTLDANGKLDKESVQFNYLRNTVSATVNVHYVDKENNKINPDTQQIFLEAGSFTVEPQAIPTGYSLLEPSSYEVFVSENGEISPSDITFKFEKTQVQGTVHILYKDDRGTEIAEATEYTLTSLGANTITPQVTLTNYALEGVSSQTVTLNQDGTVSPSSVTFTYKRKQEQLSATLTVHYQTQDGKTVAPDTVQSIQEVGSQNIFPSGQIPPEYELVGEPFIAVSLSEDGKLSPGEISFTYQLKAQNQPINTEVLIRYVDKNYYPIAEDDVTRLTSAGKHTVSPLKTFTNYTLQVKSYTVEVTETGQALPAEVHFVYEKIQTPNPVADVTIKYTDQNGTSIAADTVQRVNVVGNNTVLANPSGLPSNYELIGERQINVVLAQDGSVSPNPVIFVYKNANDNYEHYRGYAVTNARVALRNAASSSDTSITQMLERNTLLYIAGQAQINGIIYHSVQTLSGASGFITDADISKITAEQAQPYIQAYNQQNPSITQTPEKITGYATTYGMDVPLRQLASGYSQIISTMNTGSVMYLTGQMESNENYTWRVAQYNGKVGYVRSDQVRALSQSEVNVYLSNHQTTSPSNTAAPTYNPNSMSSYGYITKNNVNFRSQPNKSSAAITKIQQYGLALVKDVVSDNGVTWYKVNFNGREGYIQGDFFKQMTIHEFNQFLNSKEYAAGLKNNSASTSSGSAGSGSSSVPKTNAGTATAGNVQTLEGYNVGKWKNPNLAQASYPPFMPNITAMPTNAQGLEPSPSPTMIVFPNGTLAPGGLEAFGASASPGASTSPSPIDSAVTESTDSSSPLLAIFGISLLAIGGGAGYTIYTKNKRKQMIAQAKARQAQMQAQQRQGATATNQAAASQAVRDPFANPNGIQNQASSSPQNVGQTASGYSQRNPLLEDRFKNPNPTRPGMSASNPQSNPFAGNTSSQGKPFASQTGQGNQNNPFSASSTQASTQDTGLAQNNASNYSASNNTTSESSGGTESSTPRRRR